MASQVAAARRESPFRGARHLGLARVLVAEMPCALAAMEAGVVSEWRATLVAPETACVSVEDRRHIDHTLFADPAKTEGWGDRRLVAETRKLAYALDPQAVVDRARRAEAERRVTIRPAPDTMAHLGALLPAAQGIAVYATLGRVADTLTGQGDPRTRGQIMADTLVERVTGQTTADAVSVTVDLTVSDETLFAAGTEPAWLADYGPVPAGTVRDLVATAVADATATLRRLYVAPDTATLTATDSIARVFPAGLARFLDLRDQTCRTPWCDAPIRHHDHIRPHAAGGETSAVNGQGLCAPVQPRQASPWLEVPPRHRPTRPAAHGGDHHPHRTRPDLHRARTPTPGQGDHPSRPAGPRRLTLDVDDAPGAPRCARMVYVRLS